MTIFKKIFISLFLFTIVFGCDNSDDMNQLTLVDGELAGGDATVIVSNSKAFGTPIPTLSAEDMQRHLDGDAAFEATFVTNPSPKNGGLGPIFNNNSCTACHPSDGRAAPPVNINDMSGLFFKISIPGKGEYNEPMAVPGFGTQLQHQSVYGYQKEAEMHVEYTDLKVTFKDGTEVILRKPEYSIKNSYTNLPADVMISPRIGMPVFGLGLLEAIPESDILAHQDVNDIDGDSISGKANYVWDPVHQKTALGRFGWKAGTPSILVQSAGAYNEDMGVTNPLKPVESSWGQPNSDDSSVSPEIPMEILELVTFYTQTLGVPAARDLDDIQVIKGHRVFEQINCVSCHVPSYTTGVVEGLPELSNQTIFPYSDMLLHDMGEELADYREEFEANGREWKTRPLWGIGLTAVTSGHTNFLHDGRARNLTEAILWHGGEAEISKMKFTQLSKEEREALLRFLKSL